LADLRNASGMPLASADWLEVHHRAKLPERRAFAEMIAKRKPTRIVDLGCGTGLWLELLDEVLPKRCEFVGLDADAEALAIAAERARSWSRTIRFDQIDIETEPQAIPTSDITLAFNIFPYLDDPADLLSTMARSGGTLAVRQYDGGALRFGPMSNTLRSVIESSLRASAGTSDQFRHYDMDRVAQLIASSEFSWRELSFELFSRTEPFTRDLLAYYTETLNWMLNLLSDHAADALRSWLAGPHHGRYIFEVDLVAVLS
jgi:SAM-dependent methyltransferase